MRVLVVGSTGYIGKFVTRELVKRGYITVALARERSGIKGRIAVSKDSLHVRAELGFLMGAMKPLIEREIERLLDENLA